MYEADPARPARPAAPPAGRRPHAGLVLLAAVAVLVAALPVPAPAAAAPAPRTRVIVELAGPAALAALGGGQLAGPARFRALEQAGGHAATLAGEHRELLRRAGDRGLAPRLVHDLTAAYNGLVVELPAGQVGELADLPGVRAVHPDTSYAMALDNSVPLVGAPEVWQRTDPDGAPVTGAGTVVAILDTGVDYRHPDLGPGLGAGHKVVAGHDFVNDDPDPLDDNGHGTHVAGIVAADGAVRGVAPDARLTAYKVLGRSGSGQLADILAGLDAAVAPDNPHRADVVNMSLSGPGDGLTDPMSVAARAAVAAGVVVVAAAGNNGPNPQTVRAPAAADGVLAVGASVSGVRVPRARMVEPAELDLRAAQFGFSAAAPEQPLRLPVVDVGEGLPGSYDHLDVTGRAVLINMTRPPLDIAVHAQERGAAAALFYSPDLWRPVPDAAALPDTAAPGVAGEPAPVDQFATGVDDGRLSRLLALQVPGASAAAVQQHLAGRPVTLELTSVDATDQLADLSSRGPGGGFTQKPDLVAPGVEVLSTLPDQRHGRGTGTSMAAPHVAGAAALLHQLHPDRTGGQISAQLAGSAHRLPEPGPLAQGAGRLDLPAAAGATVVADRSAISFGLAGLAGDRIDRTATVTLRNLGDQPAELSIAAQPHPAAGDGAGAGGAEVSAEPASATLPPGGAVAVDVRVDLPVPDGDLDLTGWLAVQVDRDGGRSLSVPFLLPVRQLAIHVTPDAAPAGTRTAVFVTSPADLAGPPSVEVRCPGMAPQHPDPVPDGTRIWRAELPVADPGRCEVRATGAADPRYGGPTLTGAGVFEVAPPPHRTRGTAFWQPVGPNAEAGMLALGDHRNQLAVVPLGSASIFVTDDRLRTWREQRTMPVAGGAPAAVAVDPTDADHIYVALNGGGGVDLTYRGRVVQTRDRGTSWQTLPGRDARIDDLALDGTGRALAVADADGLRITRDQGASWTELARTWSSLRDLHWIGPDLYLATNSGLLVVRDAAGPKPAEPEVLFRPGVLGWAGRVAGDPETIVVTAYPSPWVFTSSDGGATFQEVFRTTRISFQKLELVGDEIRALQPGNLWVGSDRGQHWESWGEPMPPAIEYDVARWPGQRAPFYVSAHGAGVYAADAAGQYDRVGIPAAQVLALTTATGPAGPTLVAGTVRDSFHTVLPGRESIRPEDLEWQSNGGEGISGIAAPLLASSPADRSVVYKVRTDANLTFGIWRSDDAGASWRRLASPSEQAYALLVHPADPDRVYVSYASLTGAGLVVSTDGGATWRKVDQGRIFRALAGDPADPDRIWAGDHTGLYRSEDGGATFQRLDDRPVTAVAVDPDDPEHLVVGGRSLYSSRDGGQTLTAAGHAGLDMWVSQLQFAPGDPDRVYAATMAFFDEIGARHTGRGVLASQDGGASWQPLGRGLANPDATSLAVSEDGRHVYVGTYGGSVHRILVPGG